jgi:hypothetical protein
MQRLSSTHWLACALGALLMPGTGYAQALAESSVHLDVPEAPQPVATEGRLRLFYELLLSSASGPTPRPSQVLVRDAADGHELASFSGETLSARLMPWAPDRAAQSGVRLPAGETTVVYIELTLAPKDLPRVIRHEIRYDSPDQRAPRKVTGGQVTIKMPVAAAIHPPLRGGPWAAVFHPDWQRGHRRVPYAAQGRIGIPGRFAVDWVKLDDQGRMASGDSDIVSNAYAYAEDVLAVADAVVVATRNDFPESERLSASPRYRMEDASGNFVVLDIGDGRYAFYEHLRPGSIRVKPGQRIRRGDEIAQIGFSGSGNWPHLHFHIADAPSPLGAEGLPFALSRFRSLGSYDDIAALGKARWSVRPNETAAWREKERPADNAVVWFGEGKSRETVPALDNTSP